MPRRCEERPKRRWRGSKEGREYREGEKKENKRSFAFTLFFSLSQFRKNFQLFKSLLLRERERFIYRSRTGNSVPVSFGKKCCCLLKKGGKRKETKTRRAAPVVRFLCASFSTVYLISPFFSFFLSSEKTLNCLNHFFCEKGRDFSIVRVLETEFLCLLEKSVAVR